ncbi:MAG: hypothetical protein K2Q11_04630 [Burkholderiaceae bacterium]|nr:hypothetical protein [Burkholderiaceae bacterium]
MLIAPTVEGLLVCDAAVKAPEVQSREQATVYCRQRQLDAGPALTRLLDTLEPGGAKGQVQVGYTLTLQLLGLYQHTAEGWRIDTDLVDAYLRIIAQVRRPVVVYLAADHFDSQGPLTQELLKDPRNLMQLRDGKPLELGYFGYRVAPYTLLTDRTIPVNGYRFAALEYVAKRLMALPKPIQGRIAAITLAGELHQMFPDFENGMGAFQNVQVTDYSSASVAGFRQWLERKHGSIGAFNTRMGTSYPTFAAVPAPAREAGKEKLTDFGEHYGAFADGTLPIAGWLWDPQGKIGRFDLYVDGQHIGSVPRGLNRLDVYRAEESIRSPNVGYRYDFDYSALPAGKHRAQIVAQAEGQRYAFADVEFVVQAQGQRPVTGKNPASVPALKEAKALAGVRSWLDMPRSQQEVSFNPLAREWNAYRSHQVLEFLTAFHRTATEAGLPRAKLYSHQIVPKANSSWNHTLFAIETTIASDTPWKQGLNMYGGSTHSDWMRGYLAQRKISDYGVPEFHPQQWKTAGVHLAALQSHYDGGARFVSPYYFSIVPQRFKMSAEHSINRMEIAPDNTKDGSNQLYEAIRTLAAR